MAAREAGNLIAEMVNLGSTQHGGRCIFADGAPKTAATVADVGSKVNWLDLRLKVVESTGLAERLPELEDADIVEAVVALQTKEVACQAALKSATSVQQLNLAACL